MHQPHLARAQPQRDVLAFLRHDLRARARRARHLAALADLELDVVHRRCRAGSRSSGSALPEPHVRARARHDRVAHREPLAGAGCSASRRPRTPRARCAPSGSDRTRSRAPCRPRRTCSRLKSITRYIRLCPPPRRRIAMWPWLSRPPRLLERLEQRLLGRGPRDLVEIGDRAEAGARGDRPELTNAHVLSPRRRDRFALLERHDRLLPVRPAPGGLAHALRLAALRSVQTPVTCTPNSCSTRPPDVRLVRRRVHLERVLAALLVRRRALLGDHRAHDGLDAVSASLTSPSSSAWPPASSPRPSWPPASSAVFFAGFAAGFFLAAAFFAAFFGAAFLARLLRLRGRASPRGSRFAFTRGRRLRVGHRRERHARSRRASITTTSDQSMW